MLHYWEHFHATYGLYLHTLGIEHGLGRWSGRPFVVPIPMCLSFLRRPNERQPSSWEHSGSLFPPIYATRLGMYSSSITCGNTRPGYIVHFFLSFSPLSQPRSLGLACSFPRHRQIFVPKSSFPVPKHLSSLWPEDAPLAPAQSPPPLFVAEVRAARP